MKFLLIGILTILSLAVSTPVSDDVKAKLTTLDSPLLDVVWCGNTGDNDQNVLILTANGTVYKSVDRGENWEKLSDIFQSQAIKSTQDLQTKHGYINRIVKSPVDANLVMFLGSEGINYISEDCGNKIRSYGKGKNFREFQYHPVEREWILATSWKNCRDVSPGEQCNISRELYLTKNLGKHWEKLTDYVVQFSWGVQKLADNKKTPVSRIVWSQETGTTLKQTTSGWNMKTHLYYSDDFLKTRTMVVSSGNKFLLTESHIFVAQVLDAETQRVNLMISEADTLDYNFQIAEVSEQLKQHSFTILDSQDDTVFININHNRPSSPLGAIYKSDASGSKFIKTLEYNIRDTSDGQCDFEKVAGLEGVYIANTYGKRVADEYMSMSQAQDSDNIQFETNKFGKTKVTSNLKMFASKLQDVKQTKITFDQGGVWRPLSPPSRDSRGQSITCDVSQECSLHLHSVSSKMQFGPFYTSDNALGIIMGTGNVGRNLLHRADQVNTYLSRDAGATWYEVKKGSHIYEFSDHGGIILMADDQNSTQYLYYSWDEGFTWEKIKFYDRNVEVTNIITEPSNIGTRFLVYGTTTIETNNQQKQQGIVISVNFENLHSNCVGHDTPNTDDSDYELWSPNGKVTPDCLLGRKTTYVRRKRTAKCFNGYDFDRILNVDHCECTEDDWECDVMFERDEKTGECVFEGNREYGPNYDTPEVCENYYYVTQGYRKIAGDSCVGGVNHAPVKLPCPYFSFLGGNTWQNLFFLASFFTGVYFLYQNKELVMENLEQLVNYLSTMIQIKSNGGSSSSQSNAGQYMNFQDMDLEQNNPSFDDNLVQEKWEGEDNTEDNLAQQQQQQQQENQNENVQEKQKFNEETNLLDGDDQEDEGFDPRN